MTVSSEKVSTPFCGDTCSLLVDQNCKAQEIGIWKARIIRWLFLEWWFGKVVPMNEKGFFLLKEKIETVYKACLGDVHKQECLYNNLVDLSKKLHHQKQNPPDSTFTVVCALVYDMATALLLNHLSSQGKRVSSSEWYLGYGSIRADQLADDYQKNTLPSGRLSEATEELQKTFPEQKKLVLEAFFSQLETHFNKDELCPSKELRKKSDSHSHSLSQIKAFKGHYQSVEEQAVLKEQLRSSFYTFRAQNAHPTPAEIAVWFKEQLATISQKCSLDPTTPARDLIVYMFKILSHWKMKETFRAYGVVVAKECKESKDGIVKSFEKAALQMRSFFQKDEILLVMEGMVSEEGKDYCSAIASKVKEENLVQSLSNFVYQASCTFKDASNVIVRGVIQEIVRRSTLKFDSLKEIATIFLEAYQGAQSFAFLEPLLGSCLTVQKQSTPEAKSLAVNNLLTIEQMVVSKMMSQNSSFCSQYGRMVGESIIEAVRNRRDNYLYRIQQDANDYKEFLKEKFPDNIQPILEALESVLKNDPLVTFENLVMHKENWKKDSFVTDVGKLKGKMGFCPRLEKIVEIGVDTFITACLEDKKTSPKRPSLIFLYQTSPLLTASLKAFKESLGLQMDADEYFLKCLRANANAKEYLDWIEAVKEYAEEAFEIHFNISTTNFRTSHLKAEGVSDEERKLISSWLPPAPKPHFLPDPVAIEQSIVRSGLSSISINAVAMKEHAYSCRLVKSCAVAQALLETVSVKSRAEKHKKAIGKLLCCASIDYDPGATIPPEITCLLVEMGIQNTPPWTLKTESAAPGKIEYAFSSSHNVFAVDRDFEYSFVEKHKNQTAWHVHTTLEIDENDQDKIDVTFKSNGGSQ